jgi:1-acyl-sn-glycerol-3-phosphate acyltransferase
MDPFYRFAFYAGWPIVRLVYRLRVRGVEHLPRTGGFVVAASHASNFDPWPLAASVYPRQLRFMAKAELFEGVLGPWLRRGGVFSVRRGTGDTDAIHVAVRLVRDEGQIVLMFPHGTRRRKGRHKRRPPRPHPGAASIALAARVPLVPAALSGTDHLLHFGQMRVAYGRPICVDDLASLDPRRAAREATRRLMDAIATLESSI